MGPRSPGRKRHQRTIDRYTGGLVDIVDELVENGLVDEGSVSIRVVPDPPLSKLYLVNGTDAFFGWYAITRHKVKYEGTTIPVVDLMGKDTELLHFATTQPDQSASLFVNESHQFFEAQWNMIATPLN